MRTDAERANVRRWVAALPVILGINLAVTALISFSADYRPRNFFIALTYSTACVVIVSAAVEFVTPWALRCPRPVNWLMVFLVLLAGGIAGFGVGAVCLSVLGVVPRSFTAAHFRYALQASVANSIIFGFIGLAVQTLELRLKLRELETEGARQAANEARLSALEARIHPHFLFNTLNSISSLIKDDPDLAEHTVERLALLLRYTLDAHGSGLVPLEQELSVVRAYLEIERARYGERLRYRIGCDAGLEEVLVPPFCLQTLVENSVKYAVAPRREGADIEVEIKGEDAKLRIVVRDSGKGFSKAEIRSGHGLDLLLRRLEKLFGTAAEMAIADEGSGAWVCVSVPKE